MPRISILLPCYNAGRHISACLDSILSQTYADLEVIAVDDGSEDNTAELLAAYALRDPRIHLSRNPQNLGLIRTLNNAIRLSRGEYIARMDADDEALPDRLQSQIRFLDANEQIDMVSGSLILVDDETRVIGERQVWATQPSACRYISAFATPMAHSAVMGRRNCFNDFGYSLDPEALHTEDYELWCRLLRANRQLANLPESLLRYRISPERVSARYEQTQVQNFLSCAHSYLRAETRLSATRALVEVLTNRIDFNRADVPLDEGLRLLERLTRSALSTAGPGVAQREIQRAAAMQRFDILLQCVIKGRPWLRARALPRLVAASLPVLRRRHSRSYLRQKLRLSYFAGGQCNGSTTS